jgi:DNA polymerase III subunit gamma/tau
VSTGSSLYRRHRPRTFAEVVGQQHVVRTLTNAVEQGRVHHAYLFVGSRGTGKTSMAKILAACLNCVNGPTVTPCGACESCVSIAAASSLDVIEMDAASSNSVDDIRALRESVAYAPVSGRQKVYILDEAHMLSTAAWNAFLKTLEEPPPDTVFVLATTDAQKVLPTVVDRCHRFDFQRPTVEQIGTVVDRVARAESITIGDAAVAVLARHAAGSFRDALGTLEQLQTYAGAEVALPDVLAVLGISDADLLFRALDAVAAEDPRAALGAIAEALDGGRDPAAFIRELEAHARELLIVQMQGGDVPAELRLTADRDERLAEQALTMAAASLVRALDLLAIALTHLKAGADPRTQLELALIRAARPDLDPTVAALAARVEALEAGRPARVERPPSPAEPAAAVETRSADVAGAVDVAAAAVGVAVEVAAAAVGVAVEVAAAADVGAAADVAADVGVAPGDDRVVEASFPLGEPLTDPEPAASQPLSLDLVVRMWPTVVDHVRATNPMLGAVVGDARPVELAQDHLVLAFGQDAAFLRKKADERPARSALGEALRTVTGHALTLSYELREGEAPQTLSEDELVARLLDEFDAEVLANTDEEGR